MIHELKIWPEYYEAVTHHNVLLRKTLEIRKNDRNYQVGDELLLKEYNPDSKSYTGREAKVIVTHILIGGPWFQEEYVALSIFLFEISRK